jgi:hypothetical protein
MPDNKFDFGAFAKIMLGTCGNYVLDTNYNNYLEGLKNYFTLNGVEDDLMRVRLLINLIGTEARVKIIKAVKPKFFTEVTCIGENL